MTNKKNDKKTEKEIIKSKNKEKEKKSKKEVSPNFSLIEVIIIVLLTAVIVSVGSGLLIYNNYEKISVKTKDSKNSKYINEIEETFNKIIEDYVEKTDKQKLTNAAIEGMFNYLGDPYSSYLSKEETKELTNKLSGTYSGVGIEIKDEKGKIIIQRVFGGPAKIAGLKKGDIITKVDKVDLKNKNASYLSNYIKYKIKSSLTIEYKRNNKIKTAKLIKTSIDYPSVNTEKYNEIGYIHLSAFAKKSGEQFEDALKELERQKIKGLIIDLRANTGGYLNAAYDIAEQFLIKGKVVYQLKEKNKITKYKTKKPDKKDYKVVILIDANSASASEVLTLALKENYNATVVGEKSYGKGSVQQTNELDNGSMVKYTTAKWLSPSGKSIDKTGIIPDVNIIYEAPKNDELDNQLKKALELFK